MNNYYKALRWGSLMLLVMLTGCQRPAPVSTPIRPVRWLQVHAVPAVDANTYAGVVRARYESSLGFRVAGKVIRREVNIGDQVKAGQTLARLDASDLKLQQRSNLAEVAARKAAFDQAKADLDRYRNLVGPGYVSRSEYDHQLSAYQSAKAQLDAARSQLHQSVNQSGYANLKADHDGVITAIMAEAGQVVSAGQTVMQLARNGDVEVATSVPENRIARLRVGQAVKIRLSSVGGDVISGVIREIAFSADPATRTFDVRVHVPQPPPQMRLGMTASVDIPAGTAGSAFRLPLVALVQCGNARCVWLIDPKTSTVHQQTVAIVGVLDNDVLVGKGISDGDVVVTAGASLLYAGEKVRRLDAAESAGAG